MSVGKLTGPKKAAILLLALGEDAAAEVLKNLEEVEIQQVGYFMTRFTDIAPEEVDIVLEEFYRNSVTQEEGVNINASPDFVRNALNKAVGGAGTSQHCNGEAADFESSRTSNPDIAHCIEANLDFDQHILEFYDGKDPHSGWVHCSYRKDGSNRNKTMTALRVNVKTQYKDGLLS